MSIKPILFNTDMVRALLGNRKTVTRRAVKPQPPSNTHPNLFVTPPYRPGDILYVRETFFEHKGHFFYKADGKHEALAQLGITFKWHPSIHMPREAARIFLRVKDVRMERLQDITEEQARAEGAHEVPWAFEVDDVDGKTKNGPMQTAIQNFAGIWDSTIKKVDRALYGWDANPWVWVIEFERISRKEA